MTTSNLNIPDELAAGLAQVGLAAARRPKQIDEAVEKERTKHQTTIERVAYGAATLIQSERDELRRAEALAKEEREQMLAIQRLAARLTADDDSPDNAAGDDNTANGAGNDENGGNQPPAQSAPTPTPAVQTPPPPAASAAPAPAQSSRTTTWQRLRRPRAFQMACAIGCLILAGILLGATAPHNVLVWVGGFGTGLFLGGLLGAFLEGWLTPDEEVTEVQAHVAPAAPAAPAATAAPAVRAQPATADPPTEPMPGVRPRRQPRS